MPIASVVVVVVVVIVVVVVVVATVVGVDDVEGLAGGDEDMGRRKHKKQIPRS